VPRCAGLHSKLTEDRITWPARAGGQPRWRVVLSRARPDDLAGSAGVTDGATSEPPPPFIEHRLARHPPAAPPFLRRRPAARHAFVWQHGSLLGCSHALALGLSLRDEFPWSLGFAPAPAPPRTAAHRLPGAFGERHRRPLGGLGGGDHRPLGGLRGGHCRALGGLGGGRRRPLGGLIGARGWSLGALGWRYHRPLGALGAA